MNGKEITKAFLLMLLLAPLTVFICSMLTSLVTQLIFWGQGYHDSEDLAGFAVFGAMLLSSLACIGLVVAFVPIASRPLRPTPRWLVIVISIAILGSFLMGNSLYRHRDVTWSVATIYQTIILLSLPPFGAACMVFRFSRTSHPASESLIRPLLWAFGSIVVTTLFVALVTALFRAHPLLETSGKL